MSASRRNIVVGFTVMVSLIVLGWMLLRFGPSTTHFFQKGKVFQIRLITHRADGLAEGSQVQYLGLSVGHVTLLRQDPNRRDVIIEAEINTADQLPDNVEGLIRVQSPISGSAVMSLEVIGGPTVAPSGTLKDGASLTARFVGNELIPPEFAALATELGKTATDIRNAKLVAHLDESVRSAGDTMKSLNQFVSDPKLKEDLQTSIANFRTVTETANRAAGNLEKFSTNLEKVSTEASGTLADARATIQKSQANIDRLGDQLTGRMEQLSKLLDSFQSISTKIDKGQGTMGLMLNDPKLYQSLVDSSRELNGTITDLKRLVEQWEQEGLSLKLK